MVSKGACLSFHCPGRPAMTAARLEADQRHARGKWFCRPHV